MKIRDEVFSDKNISLNNKNKEIIFRLSNCGIFNLKDSVVLVAEQLGISKTRSTSTSVTACNTGAASPEHCIVFSKSAFHLGWEARERLLY